MKIFPLLYVIYQCCVGGAESRGVEIKLPPGAVAEITNCSFDSVFFLFITDLKKIL
jgi:hypothetical protein